MRPGITEIQAGRLDTLMQQMQRVLLAVADSTKKQLPRSPRRNGLPVKLVDGAFMMRHEYLACALLE